MKREGSLPNSQELFTCTYPEPDQSSPQHSILSLKGKCYNTDAINKNTEIVIDASKEVGLEVNVEKTKYMLVSRDQNAGQIRDKK
jgi:hypothetical protein